MIQQEIIKSTKKFWQKWSIAFRIMPIVAFVAILKFLSHNYEFDFLELNGLFTSLVAGTIFLIGFLFFITILSIIFNPISFTIAWSAIFSLCVMAFLFSIPKRFYNRKLIKAVLYLPVGFFWMMAAMFNMKGYTKRPTNTSHTITDFEIK